MLVYIIGFFSGILSGLAVGGGTLLVPALIFFQGVSQHAAQGVSLASFLPTSAVAVVTHYRQGNVKPKLALYLAIGAIIGAIAGASIAAHISDKWLERIFGVFLIGMGIYEFCCKGKQEKGSE